MSDEITTASLDATPEQRFIRLRRELGVTSFGLNAIVLAPGERNRIHTHKRQEEVYVVLDGTLTLGLQDGEQDFTTGQVVRVPPALRRQLINRGPATLKLLALGGDQAHEHEPRDADAYRDWQDQQPGSPADVPLPQDLPASERRS
ncbi:MAG: cupin domain-containing protein [Solirubrobacterales bacterium]|nr:cupin domain-containing protein [Solirubrobacterales bacterium]